ncbi:ribulokinase [Treponema sp. OMZ 840]|uniref:ribulokinase n=1 Tax=Treponema sp. OMZ 840 TaxID=244313 RepID=UPI003D946310
MKKSEHFVLGADFGSDSVRVVVLDAFDGSVAGSKVSWYPRWKKGLFCNAKENRFRQHPLDYIESFTEAVKGAVAQAAEKSGIAGISSRICSICIDTTGSTPAFTDKDGMPLALSKEFADDPDAMFVLWKDHTAVAEADEINRLCKTWGGQDYTLYSGGTYSSEWFWSKLLHIVRKNPKVKKAAVCAVEHCDWMTALLCGTAAPDKIKRSRCAAGHKCMWHKSWGGYPSTAFLAKLDSKLADIQPLLGSETFTTEKKQGLLTKEWSDTLGLKEGITVCVGGYDAHVGTVGGGVADGVMVKSMGTSTCDIIVAPLPSSDRQETCIAGICGQVDGSVIEGKIGYEAGQSSYGDYYNWFRTLLLWPFKNGAGKAVLGRDPTEEEIDAYEKHILADLEKACENIPVTETLPVALDWINGRRTPHANQNLTAWMSGISLGTDAPAFMRMLLEATAFGSRSILECFEKNGIAINKIIAVGGVARKSRAGMQILADVTNREIQVTESDLSPSIGAAVFAATAAGLYKTVEEAQKKLAPGVDRTYKPDPKKHAVYEKLYKQYLELGAAAENGLKNRGKSEK